MAGFTDLTGGLSMLDIVRLAQLYDVAITSATDGQVLTYNAATSTWINATGGGVPQDTIDALTHLSYALMGG